ncbi:MAG: hypothetical protein H6985_05090 [Pseudomonadales bacterium]|nr:hypothetical protein [Pseudomonadales bacterium]
MTEVRSSSFDDLQQDLGAILLGLMVLLFVLVLKRDYFHSEPSQGYVRIAALFYENAVPSNELTGPAAKILIDVSSDEKTVTVDPRVATKSYFCGVRTGTAEGPKTMPKVQSSGSGSYDGAGISDAVVTINAVANRYTFGWVFHEKIDPSPITETNLGSFDGWIGAQAPTSANLLANVISKVDGSGFVTAACPSNHHLTEVELASNGVIDSTQKREWRQVYIANRRSDEREGKQFDSVALDKMKASDLSHSLVATAFHLLKDFDYSSFVVVECEFFGEGLSDFSEAELIIESSDSARNSRTHLLGAVVETSSSSKGGSRWTLMGERTPSLLFKSWGSIDLSISGKSFELPYSDDPIASLSVSIN